MAPALPTCGEEIGEWAGLVNGGGGGKGEGSSKAVCWMVGGEGRWVFGDPLPSCGGAGRSPGSMRRWRRFG